ncbi:unnamed protein product [Prorocentrum cordatum]|uniref:Uncharacterized protein n=1 Tax=Prorocentrum cordatum TaxID=2364126 RepID=A0ABN9W6D5_9DINO|nr:unnamed protein product [Polarella glacialis]
MSMSDQPFHHRSLNTSFSSVYNPRNVYNSKLITGGDLTSNVLQAHKHVHVCRVWHHITGVRGENVDDSNVKLLLAVVENVRETESRSLESIICLEVSVRKPQTKHDLSQMIWLLLLQQVWQNFQHSNGRMLK